MRLESATLATGFKASMTVGIPGLGEGGVEASVEASFTNSFGSR